MATAQLPCPAACSQRHAHAYKCHFALLLPLAKVNQLTGSMLVQASFNQMVDQGYQASQTWHQGKPPSHCITHNSDLCNTNTPFSNSLVCLKLIRVYDAATTLSRGLQSTMPGVQARWSRTREVALGPCAPAWRPQSGRSRSLPWTAGGPAAAGSAPPPAGCRRCPCSSRTGR